VSFLDRFGFTHDKECFGGQASSGNPAIYSAINSIVFNTVPNFKEPFKLMYKTDGASWTLIRHVDNPDIASLDEIIGWIYLGNITLEDFRYNWRWYDQSHNPGKWRVFQAAVYCAGKHRNFFKINKVRDLHPMAYWVPPHVQYYLLKKYNKDVGILRTILFYAWALSVLMKRNFKKGERQTGVVSQKNILFVILKDLHSRYLIKLLNYKKNLRDYFRKEHPIHQAMV